MNERTWTGILAISITSGTVGLCCLVMVLTQPTKPEKRTREVEPPRPFGEKGHPSPGIPFPDEPEDPPVREAPVAIYLRDVAYLYDSRPDGKMTKVRGVVREVLITKYIHRALWGVPEGTGVVTLGGSPLAKDLTICAFDFSADARAVVGSTRTFRGVFSGKALSGAPILTGCVSD